MIGQAEKEQSVGTVLAKFPEFRQKCRKIFLSAHGISVYDNGIAHGSIRDDAIHTAPEIQTFVIFQRQIGTGILAVQIQQCSGMLEFLHPMGLFLQPGTQGTDDGGKNRTSWARCGPGAGDGRSHMPKIMPSPCPKLSVRETDALPEAARRI